MHDGGDFFNKRSVAAHKKAMSGDTHGGKRQLTNEARVRTLMAADLLLIAYHLQKLITSNLNPRIIKRSNLIQLRFQSVRNRQVCDEFADRGFGDLGIGAGQIF